ncbi:serine/threonine-protein kinase [Kitasatospora sp. NPDC059817]|uniref:serine/threonine-protein kinase n=1 Tax=Kitasatospora sp. NPDC059817 TaxID=3346961 RepID=UPI00364BB586
MRPVGSKYLLEETLGRGATGTVWRGRVRPDVQVPGSEPGQLVAIKVLREELASDPDVVMRFLRERSLLLRLTHPNIVRVRDLVVEGELLALVMDLIDGPDLARYLRSNGPFSPIAGALLMAQVADALAASHEDGIVHRDLKPANVLLASTVLDGTEQMHPMLTDFGIARLADSPGITRTHEFVGTPAYIAPESAEGRPQTSAVDVYGAGIMLYELVTGRQPFQGDSAIALLHAHLAQEPQRPSTMPEPLWTVIERCLRKDPAQRPSATSLARALRVVAAGVGVHASPSAVDEALAVGSLLLPDPRPTSVPSAGAGVPGLSPAAPAAPQYDPAGATQVMGTQPPPAPPFGAPDRTQVMPPTVVPPPPPGAPGALGAPAEETPHPWQTQLRAARDRNQQTQVGYFGPEDFEDPQVAPRPFQAGPAGPPGYQPQPPAGYHPDRRRQGPPPPGYAQRPPVAPPPYRGGQGGQGYQAGQSGHGGPPQPGPGGRPQPPGGYRPAPAAYGQSQGGYPPPPAPVPRRAEPPAPQHRESPQHREPPQHRESPQRRDEPREQDRREPAPPRERRPRSRNRMYIPGLGCLKGCLVVLVVLVVAGVALWNFTPLPHYWDNIQGWFNTVRDWADALFGSSKN